MKKVLALILALIMVFSLVACGGGDDNKTSDNGGNTPATDNGGNAGNGDNGGDVQAPEGPTVEGATPNMNADGTPNLDLIAHYDANYDYTQNPQYTFEYHAYNADVLYQQSAYAFEHWCGKMNLKWNGFVSANNDADMFMTNLSTSLDQGLNAVVMDPDLTTYPAILDILSNYPDVVWMSQMGNPRDDGYTGNMVANFVGFDYFDMGVQGTEKLNEWMKANYPNVDLGSGEVGFLAFTLEVAPPLAQRAEGAKSKWLELGGKEDDCYVVDIGSYGMTIQGGMDAASPVLSTNTQYKYWLVFGLLDDLAQGATSVITTMGLTDTSCVVAIGGAGLQAQFDGGQYDAFRYCYFTPNLALAEPIIGCLYAQLQGWVTVDSVWPSWVRQSDHGADPHTYSTLYVPSYWMDKDNYQEMMEWADVYSGGNMYNYDVPGVTADTYNMRVSPAEAPSNWLD